MSAASFPSGEDDGSERTERRIKTEKASPSSGDVSHEKSGGKRICIQDADGKIFFLQCPEGFAGGEGEEAAVPLAAWVSSSGRKRPHSGGKKSGSPSTPAATAAALVKLKKPKPSQRLPDRKPIQYETGFDPSTGEIKGPDIDPSEIFGIGFNRNESAAVRDVKSAEDLNKAWFTTAKDKEALQDKGINWKQGAWSQEEVAILNENIKEYCHSRGIEDPAHVIFNMSKEERSDFYPSIAKGLQRPLFAVYRRVKRDYDVNNHKGVYTQSELQTLKLLLNQYGPDWKLIGEKLGRSAQSVKDRCRQFKESDRTLNNGKWGAEEEKRLIMAVHEVGRPSSGSSSEQDSWVITSGKWREVATLVKTRSEKQCRIKWSEIVKASIAVGAGVAAASSSSSSSLVPVSSSRGNNGVAEWGSEEDAQLLNTLNKVISNSSHPEFKTSSLEAADFGASLAAAAAAAPPVPNEPSSSREAIVSSTTSASAASSVGLLSTIPLVSSSHHEQVASAAAAGIVTPAIHVPPPAIQHHHHHVMSEPSYIWTHHAL